MSFLKIFFFLIVIFTIKITAQLSAPEVEAVYGGRIHDITGYAITSNTSRIFISTESSNSVFYTDVNSKTASPTFSNFIVMPGIDANAGFGSFITNIEVHRNSGYLFFIFNNDIIKSHPSSSSSSTVYSGLGQIDALNIIDDYLFFIESGNFHFGTLDASGNFSEYSGSPISVSAGFMLSIVLHPLTEELYVFTPGNSPSIVQLSDTFNSLNSSTSTISVPVSVSSSYYWSAFGISPDGTFVLSGHDGHNKYFAYRDTTSTWNELSMDVNGISGNNFAFAGDSTNFYVYTAKVFSSKDSLLTNWETFGVSGSETHPNDGAVFVDPINDDIVYMTTDQGIGTSTDNGFTIFEIDDGVESVVVADFSMTDDKNTAWLASKSGIRKVTNYTTSPLWTNSIFPNNDGSPYYSAEMSMNDNNRVFAGNIRIYKTDDDGSTWSQVFTPENSPYNFSNIWTRALAIEECRFAPNIVMAGFEIADTDKGGLFVSEDYGSTWSQILLEASSVGNDVDVSDIVFVQEGTDTIAYVSAIYDASATQGRSIYRVVKNGSTWSTSQDMGSSGTAVGYSITATILDLELTTTGDTLYATGTDAGTNHPITYYKDFSGTALWTTMTTSGYPFSSGKKATAITIGIDTVYVAVDNEIFYFPIGGSSWSLGYSYPVGTKINFLYFDELLAGTDLGLYAHFGTTITNILGNRATPQKFELKQNYPNPFNPSTIISYNVAKTSNVQISIF